jgi:AraC family transcriptional regulator of adaptative response / DNA-3-methyladenine glycosylase II
MALDQDRCYRAFVARDRRFDGRFFTAVLSTGVYCRPVCPARRPARENVRFFACAAAAESAGFRPCLRCRPETAPGSPAWLGTSATVARALRLIEDGVLDRDGVVGLAARLGVTDRWLRQLFDQQLGASPLAVARTRRIHFARRLLDETTLPLEDVAQAAGFGSARRLRDAIQATFHRSPAMLRGRRVRPGGKPTAGRGQRGAEARATAGAGARRAGAAAALAPLGGPVLRVPARPPFAAAPLLRFFADRAVPGVESFDGVAYRRSAVVDGEAGIVEVRPVPGAAALDVGWSGGSARGLLELATRVGRLFDLQTDVATIGEQLRRDPLLARRWPAHGVRVPGAWEPFEIVVRGLLGQQVSVAAARTLLGRLVERCGTPLGRAARGGVTHLFPGASQIAGVDPGALGVTRSRAAALHGLAEAVASGTFDLALPLDLDAAVARLTAFPGVGAWTAQYIAMRALGETDAFPAGDLGVRKALATRGRMPSESEALARAERWRPWRAYAAVALWSGGAGGAPTRRQPASPRRASPTARREIHPETRTRRTR